jgi:hypothetical protein
MLSESFITFLFFLRFGKEIIHAKYRFLMHFKLNWGCSDCLVLGSSVGSLSMNCTTISKQWLIIKVVTLTVRVSSL